MRNILVVSGHPNLAQSTTNKVIVSRLQNEFSQITVRDLGALYPTHQIDVAVEQAEMLKADVIVFQFPLYWFSVPGLLKTYIDQVLSHGFAFGSQGSKIAGKKIIYSFTAGAPEDQYSFTGYERFPLQSFLPPFFSLSSLCGLEWQEPVYSFAMHYIPGISSEEDLARVQAQANDHADRLIQQIKSL